MTTLSRSFESSSPFFCSKPPLLRIIFPFWWCRPAYAHHWPCALSRPCPSLTPYQLIWVMDNPTAEPLSSHQSINIFISDKTFRIKYSNIQKVLPPKEIRKESASLERDLPFCANQEMRVHSFQRATALHNTGQNPPPPLFLENMTLYI